MIQRDARRQAVLERIAEHLLAHGLGASSLRPLAAAAGISDRMLLYYFSDKNEVLSEALALIAGRLASDLEALGGAERRPLGQLLTDVAAVVRAPAVQPFMRLWLELAAQAARGAQPYGHIAAAIAAGFITWIEQRLDGSSDPDRASKAALLLALIEGAAVLDAVGRTDTAEAALRAMRSTALD